MRSDDPAADRPPVSVGVSVDLYWSAEAGGHVKCWERFAEQAALRSGDVDLTIYMLGDGDKTIDIGGATRVRLLPPKRGTDRYAATRGGGGGGDTDLARNHAGLAKLIRRHDVLHATGPFSFGRTMKRVADQTRTPFIYSIHTDHAAFARVYSERIIRRRFGENWVARMALGRFDAKDRAEKAMRKRVLTMVAGADALLYSRDSDRAYAQQREPPRAVGKLRRGVDASRFNPAHRNAAKMKRAFGIPEEALILLFVGRIDESKGVDILIEAARRLLDIGLKIHILAVGGGGQEEAFRRAVGPNASLPGPLAQETLATIYASSDVFVFP
ncbi:MAG: glycosyltransferase, partial [Pseudomonadota bacterium]